MKYLFMYLFSFVYLLWRSAACLCLFVRAAITKCYGPDGLNNGILFYTTVFLHPQFWKLEIQSQDVGRFGFS